jgi:hypothetical protein
MHVPSLKSDYIRDRGLDVSSLLNANPNFNLFVPHCLLDRVVAIERKLLISQLVKRSILVFISL